HPHKRCPSKTFVILESRARIGGTWDLFRYPGVRSDSDMFTMAYAFRPWRIPTSISDGHLIREYIADTASEEGIDKHTPAGASSSSGVAPQRSLVPALAKMAAHVTMLQRSPTYVVSLPALDAVAIALSRILPSPLAHGIARWKNIGFMT